MTEEQKELNNLADKFITAIDMSRKLKTGVGKLSHFSGGRQQSKSLEIKDFVERVFKVNPNAKILLIDRLRGEQIIVSDKNTEFKEYKDEIHP